jgi:mRNA interferase RelE/StbE
MSGPVFRIVWTATAVKLAEAITDRRERRLVVDRAAELAEAPEQQGSALVGELAGFRSVRAAGQRYRIIYRVERREIIVTIVAVGRRKAGDRADIYALARKLFRQRLL